MSMFKTFFITAGASAVALLAVACGDNKSTSPQSKVVTEDAVVTVTATTIPVIFSAPPAEFPAGVPDFGTNVATTLSFSANDTAAATPVFSVKTATDSASGLTTFGSCIFTVTTSTFPAQHALAVGKTVTINPCSVNIATAGTTTGTPITTPTVEIVLGTTKSTKIEIPNPIVVTPSGEVKVTVDGEEIVLGEVPVVTGTGGNN